MASTAIDWAIFRDILSSEAMRRVFSDEHRVQRNLNIETALAQVQAKLGLTHNVLPTRSRPNAPSTVLTWRGLRARQN